MNDKISVLIIDYILLIVFASCFGLWQGNVYAGFFMFGFMDLMRGKQ